MACYQAQAAEQAEWRSSGERPTSPQRHLLDPAVRAPWRVFLIIFGTTCYNRFVSLAAGLCLAGSQVLEQDDLIIDGCEPLDASHFSKPDLKSQPTFPSEVPIDAAAVSLNAAHELADAVFEYGLPRH